MKVRSPEEDIDMGFELSFIIPAYNSEDSLLGCIESIENDIQESNKACELLIIENGSNDKTWNVGKALKEKYENIVLLKSDKGVSKARNEGIKQANGKWLVFVDADDEWIGGSITKILKQVEDNDNNSIDLLMYSYYKGDKRIVHNYKILNTVFFDCLDDFKAWLLVRPTLRMQVWAKVFKSSVIEKHNLRFDEGLSFSEDSEFLLRYVQYCDSVFVADFPIYKYSCNGVSTVRTYNPDRQKMYLKSLEATSRDVENESIAVKEAYVEYVLAHLNLIAVHDIFDLRIKGSFWGKYKNMRRLIKEPVFEKALCDIPLKQCLNIQLSPEACIKCHLSLVGGAICYFKAYLNFRQQR